MNDFDLFKKYSKEIKKEFEQYAIRTLERFNYPKIDVKEIGNSVNVARIGEVKMQDYKHKKRAN